MPPPSRRARLRPRVSTRPRRDPTVLAELNPHLNPSPTDGPSPAGIRIARAAVALLTDRDEPAVTSCFHVIDGCAEALLTLIAMTPPEVRDRVYARTRERLDASVLLAFEAWDKREQGPTR